MDGIEQLKDDLRAGRIDALRLLDLIVSLQRQLQAAQQRIAELEKELAGSTTAKIDEAFSLRAEEKRQEARGKKKRKTKRQGRRGRFTTAEKVAQAERSEEVFPDGVDKSECQLSHTRPVWRLERGRAVLIAYPVFGTGPGVPASLSRSCSANRLIPFSIQRFTSSSTVPRSNRSKLARKDSRTLTITLRR